LDALFGILIKLQTSLMLSFTFELFIEISFRYMVQTPSRIIALSAELFFPFVC
jgi:hypothetical protein